MIICDEKKFIFIHIPKNAGTTMSKILLENYKCNMLSKVDYTTGIDKMHLYDEVIDKYISKEVVNTYKTFCIIRNPYEKIYSAWQYLRKRYKYNNINDFVNNHLDEEFIFGFELIPMDARVHYRPQYTFIYDLSGNKTVDFIIRYENLNNDIIELNNKFNLKIPMYGNETKYKKLSYINNFNNNSINKINKLYQKDFEYFNYEMILK